MCTITTPIKNLSNEPLTDVQVALGTSNLFSAFDDCGVNGTSGNCENANGKSIMMFSLFNQGISYDIPDYTAQQTQSTYTSAMFSFLNSQYDWVATYTKDGETYRGKVHACDAKEESSGGRDFELRHQENLFGDVKVIGNTVLCKLSGGVCVETSSNLSNAKINLERTPKSTATLSIPDNAVVKYARLYWQGRKKATKTNVAWDESSKTAARQIRLKKDNGSYMPVTADILDTSSTESINWVRIYSASADVTNLIDGNGTYAIEPSSLYTNTGKTWDASPSDGLGNYGAWTLVVVYKDPDAQNARNVSIFDGYKTVYKENDTNHNVDITVSGFLTPKAGLVKSTLYNFVAEGDKYITGDKLKMAGKLHNTSLQDISVVNNNAFNSSISIPAERKPDLTNNNGIDIQTYNVGTGDGGNGIITNNETGATFKFTTDGDTYFPSLLVFSTELYAPKICYDYTYGQNGSFTTAPSTTTPQIDGTFDKNQPIDVKLFFENQENSDVVFSNLSLDIDPIDISKAKYYPNSTYVAKPNQYVEHIKDTDLNISSNRDYLNNIYISDFGSSEHFYTYYSLQAETSTIQDMPINATLKYDLNVKVDGNSVFLDSMETSIQSIDPCQNNLNYNPAPGIFNIVHDGQSKSSDPYFYFNLPTQVVGRAGNYKLEAMDSDDINRSKIIDPTIVAVEMVDVSGFHYATATCLENNTTALSKRVWTILDNNTKPWVDLDKNSLLNAKFFSKALQNAAFKLSYIVADDNTSRLSLTEVSDGKYKITNFPSYAGTTCSEGFVPTIGNSKQVTTYCGNNGNGVNSGMDIAALSTCMECLYGLNTKQICSRDNFAIRPEAFVLTIKDQNQTDALQNPLFIIKNTSAASMPIDLAAGYEYALEVNASDHKNNISTPGYNGIANLNLIWNPTTGDCQDESNTSQIVGFFNGDSSDINISKSQVGKYTLSIVDSHWTDVDHNTVLMKHHLNNFFKAGKDCIENSDIVHADSSYQTNGCDINTSHTNLQYPETYKNIDIDLHPYKFDVSSIIPSTDLDHNAISPTSYVYVANISNSSDENMSFHLNGNIVAKGYNNENLSNFTQKCYAENLKLTLNRSSANLPESLQYRFHSFDANGSQIRDTNATDLNNSITPISIISTDFSNDLNGTASTILNINYARKINTAFNPQILTFKNYKVVLDKDLYANLDNQYNANGLNDINTTIKFYFARTHTPRQRYFGSEGNATIYYEVYNDIGNDGNKSLLPDDVNSTYTDDPRWFINTKHTSSYGKANNITQRGAAHVTVVNGTEPTGNHPDIITLQYDKANGFPYKATMQDNASNWLIYNKYNVNATANEFEVEFFNNSGSWAGVAETNTTTKRNAAKQTNRRLMW
jgi:hypothetical protein